MTHSDLPYVGSDKLDLGGLAQHHDLKVNMSDPGIRDSFQPHTQESGVLKDDQLHFSSPYPQDEFSNRSHFSSGHNLGEHSNKGDAVTGNANHCDVTPSATAADGSSTDAFIQQLSKTDPTLATMLTDAQQQMSPTAAAQLESNVTGNFNNNNGQFPTDSSLMNASIGQLNGQGVSSGDVTAAQNSVSTDVANPNISDNAVSNYSSAGSSPTDSASSSSSCPPSSSDTSGGSNSSSSTSDSVIQQEMNQLLQDLQSGNFQQFLQDLMKDLPDLLGSSSGSSPGSDSGGSTSPTTSPTDGSTTPVTPPTTGGTQNPLGQSLANTIVKNDGTASAASIAQVQQTLEYGTPQSILRQLQQNGTQISVTGKDIGSAGMNNGSDTIVISDNPNDTPPGMLGEVTVHEASEIFTTSTGFTSTQAFQSAAQKDLANLAAGALNNLPVSLVDAPIMTAADGTQVGMSDVASEITTYIAANKTGNGGDAISGEGATLAQLFPNVYALEQQSIG